MEMREKMCTMLGLEAGASDDDVLAKIKEIQDKGAEVEVELSARAGKDAEIVALTAKVTDTETKLTELQVQLSAANEAAAKLASEKLEADAVAAFDKLCAEGKALPRERDVCLSAYKNDPEGTLKAWELRGAVIVLSTVSGISDPEGSSVDDRKLAAYTKAIAEGKSAADAHSIALSIQ